ncbi:MAG: hypothetical protein AAF664_20330 [Planctomycetota bacterium]
MIVIHPCGGLCNRFRAMDSAIELAKMLDRPLHMVWQRLHEFNCRFDHLFERPSEFVSIVDRQFKAPHWDAAAKEILPADFDEAFGDIYISQPQIKEHLAKDFDFSTLGTKRRIIISSWFRFLGSPMPRYGMFQPVVSLRRRIEALGISGDEVGVHVRRTDHSASIESSTTAAFEIAMQREIDEDPAVRFFLATDDGLEEKRLQKRFGNRVWFVSKSARNRDSREGMCEAVVDLYGLSQCRKILGSVYSTFSVAAHELAGAPLDVMRRESDDFIQ